MKLLAVLKFPEWRRAGRAVYLFIGFRGCLLLGKWFEACSCLSREYGFPANHCNFLPIIAIVVNAIIIFLGSLLLWPRTPNRGKTSGIGMLGPAEVRRSKTLPGDCPSRKNFPRLERLTAYSAAGFCKHSGVAAEMLSPTCSPTDFRVSTMVTGNRRFGLMTNPTRNI